MEEGDFFSSSSSSSLEDSLIVAFPSLSSSSILQLCAKDRRRAAEMSRCSASYKMLWACWSPKFRGADVVLVLLRGVAVLDPIADPSVGSMDTAEEEDMMVGQEVVGRCRGTWRMRRNRRSLWKHGRIMQWTQWKDEEGIEKERFYSLTNEGLIFYFYESVYIDRITLLLH